jgi:SAM-dependent methyltransferase
MSGCFSWTARITGLRRGRHGSATTQALADRTHSSIPAGHWKRFWRYSQRVTPLPGHFHPASRAALRTPQALHETGAEDRYGGPVLMQFIRFALFASVALVIGCSSALAQSDKQPVFGQAGKDVVWVPLPDRQVEKLLDLALVTPSDFVMDLGSGDGRLVLAAARRGARARGIEFEPDLVSFSRHAAVRMGLAERAEFIRGDLFEADLSPASVITLFLLESMNIRLRPTLLALKPGTRIVANTFGLGDWQPDTVLHYPDNCDAWCAHYLWIVPARVGGSWRAPEGTLSLEQHYQVLRGTLGTGALAVPITDGKLEGDTLRFTAGGAYYAARVQGNAIEGTVGTGAGLRPWRAQRISD